MWLVLGSSIVGLFHIWVFPRIKIDHFFFWKKRISVDICVHFVGNLGYNAFNICCFSNSFIYHGCTCRLSVGICFVMLSFFLVTKMRPRFQIYFHPSEHDFSWAFSEHDFNVFWKSPPISWSYLILNTW